MYTHQNKIVQSVVNSCHMLCLVHVEEHAGAGAAVTSHILQGTKRRAELAKLLRESRDSRRRLQAL